MTTDTAERTARAHLSASLEPGLPDVLRRVVETSGAAVVDTLLAGSPELDPDGRLRRRLHVVRPQEVLSRARRGGISFVVPGERGWPDGLDDLATTVRERRGGVPTGLWVRGTLDPAALVRSVAVVGSRAATAYGTTVATDWSATLAERDVSVVSGAAYGVDAAAHRGALAVDGRTVAVLAGGLDQPYPRGNAALIERIAHQGALVSEAAPGSPINRGRFLSRNRLIAAMSAGALVVEAGARSGALSTARWALALMRPVAALPGPVTSAMSLGTHQLLREQDAVLVSRPEEVVELVGDLGNDAAGLPVTPDRPLDGLPEVALTVHEALPPRGITTVAEVMVVTGLTLPVAVRALADLRERGLAEGAGETWRRLPPRRGLA